MSDLRDVVDDQIISCGHNPDFVMSANNISNAICRLKPNKNDGGTGLSTSHFRFANAQFSIPTACLFSGMLVHGSVPDDLMLSTVFPIPKGYNVNLTD